MDHLSTQPAILLKSLSGSDQSLTPSATLWEEYIIPKPGAMANQYRVQGKAGGRPVFIVRLKSEALINQCTQDF